MLKYSELWYTNFLRLNLPKEHVMYISCLIIYVYSMVLCSMVLCSIEWLKEWLSCTQNFSSIFLYFNFQRLHILVVEGKKWTLYVPYLKSELISSRVQTKKHICKNN
ncbi:hypothetical protein NERG_00219 [Nematocida ausubeli]|uniref:Uncharacterized protein n=1 Tax=Nematocida ausubeli (strain ATCC PRA-371 / ERTm2) TaxID=1913371 RepID=H8Z9E8_NEMA1|nr:hypothetical protein NERG_00219 [Nematocida ausubeli]